MSAETFQSWGRVQRNERRAVSEFECGDAFAISEGSVLPVGCGRSYGDSCLNDAGTLIDMRRHTGILSFDEETGLLEAKAGTLLRDITQRAAPAGWFLPVTPGTQFVTLGGAIANDVHGKNHHLRGTFGRWVRAFPLLRSDAPVRDLEPGDELFAATIGGMGLTGIVERATIQLMRVGSTAIRQTTKRFDHLGDFFPLCEEAEERHEYVVAWIDSLAGGDRLGRGHLICGDHETRGDRSGVARSPIATVPFTPPLSPLAGPTLRAFNEIYYRRMGAKPQIANVPFDAFFYPLDRVRCWNRLYGPRGLHQHQSVVPLGDAPRVVRALIEAARARGQGSFLTVLKRFAALPSPGLLSFPREGYTLTLDFAHKGGATLALLDELDMIAISAGGAVNPYKDGRMSREVFARSFPQWRKLEGLRDPRIASDFWRRVTQEAVTAGRDDEESLRQTA
ncbi:FAD-binding oxidoreductase [Aureimonas mangrovi]|uniref:FAD-binding oxidoreductase n=1 Tax=Aureimonas mangrovi TaxID=2758041 RepID=UPI00163DC647|nr:FAD-binding oxidoreductase [Aureimonas mangrovi]